MSTDVPEIARLTIVPTAAEAEFLCGLLRTAGIKCDYRQTNVGAGAMDGMAGGGAQEIVVAEADLALAQQVLESTPESE